MTSNERKIINFLREAKEKTHTGLIAKKINFSSGYTRFLCRSLARAGYIKFEDSNICYLLKKGHGYFENVAVMSEVSEPVAVAANVTLLTDEPIDALLASDRDDKDEEENREDGDGNKEDDQHANGDAELNKALADLNPMPKTEAELKSEPAGPASEQARYGAGVTEEEKMEKPDKTELKPEPKAEEEKPAVAEAMAGKEKELTEEAKAGNPEKTVLKEESAKPSNGFGASLKKIANWFTEKK